jgi:hypothetical protein
MTLKAAAPSSSQEACKIPWVFCESWFGKLVKQSHHLHFNWNGDPLLLHKWKKKPKRTAPKQKKEPAADVPHLQHQEKKKRKKTSLKQHHHNPKQQQQQQQQPTKG